MHIIKVNKTKFKKFLIFSVSFSLFLISCKKNPEQPENIQISKKNDKTYKYEKTNSVTNKTTADEIPAVNLHSSLAAKQKKNISGSAEYVELMNLFSPDYEYTEPDSLLTDIKTIKQDSEVNSNGEESENHIPGLRKLSDYITKYNPIKRTEEAKQQLSKKYLIDDKAQKHIQENNANNYEILPVIYFLEGGFNEKDIYSYSDITGALPGFENKFYIRLNTMVSQEYITNNLEVKIDGNLHPFSLQPDYNHDFFKYSYPQNSDEINKLCDSYIVTINSNVERNKIIFVKLKNPKEDKRQNDYIEKQYSYKSLTAFKALEIDYHQGSTKGKSKPITITFSQIPDENTIIDNIKFDFDYTLKKNNFQIDGRNLTIFNLPIDYNENHSIRILKDLKDIYGQNNSYSRTYYSFKIEDEPASVQFLDYGFKMMEAQFPHKLTFAHRNLETDSFYRVSKAYNPYNLKNVLTNKYGEKPEDTIQLEEAQKNIRYYEDIDLNPLLSDDGFGLVKFEASVKLREYNNWRKQYDLRTNNNAMTVQVTDLGVTARIGINKAVLMVRSLSTGKPVSNADVNLFYTAMIEEIEEFSPELCFAKGKTDSNGVLEIDFTENEVNAILHPDNSSSSSENAKHTFAVMVQNGNDKAIFTPTTHNLWRNDINTSSIQNVTKPKQRTFIFVDRGVYKPGETVSWRGIDKNLRLGNYEAAAGDYSILIQGNWWKAPQIGEEINGTLSESGGFSGSFQLPDDIKPGYYKIVYYRKENKNDQFECSFQVAEFERVKTQIAVTVPDMIYYGGDKLNATVTAEYLAGGVLANADYEYNWYTQGTNFFTDEPESRDYSFGPYENYSSRTYYSSEKGKLSSNGSATASCNSKTITDGKTYTYRFETAVTDVSNQRISAVKNITVHPALFYIGLQRARNVRGFAKKGTALEFPFILTDVKGKLLSENNITSIVQNMEYSLTHEEWSLVHEQSVDNTIYTRYTKKDVEDESGKVKINSKGILTLTPKACGWYTLKLSGKDIKENHAETSIKFYVTGSDAFFHNNYNSQGINLTTDKKEYLPGETAQILMESPLPKGDYLITVEREGIFASEIRHIESSTDVLEVPVAKDFVPIVYVTVASYSERNGEPTHSFGQPDMDKPKQYFGATSIFVNPYTKAFNITIETDKNFYKPGEEATLTLTATKNGKPLSDAELTVMAVDRGVLDLINYHVPNPIEYFYSPYIFEDYVIGGDSRAFLMDPVSYSIKNLQGGDADETKEDERKDFRPTALFEPVIITDKNGKATVTFRLPDSLTTYRITAFGVKENYFGLQEEEAHVQNPVNIQAVQPRKLRESDTAECGVLITNLTNSTQKITVTVEPRKPVKDTKEDELAGRKTAAGEAFVDGSNSHTVSVLSGDSSVVYFDIGAKTEGTVELVYKIESDAVNEKLVSPIKIEKSYIYETQIVTSEATEDENKTAFIIPSIAKDLRGDFSITLDATRLGLLNSSVNYLFDYPYNCLEQQTSRILPLILFGKYIDAFDMNSKVSDIKKCVTTATQNWGKVQLENGGFPYWPDEKYDSFYVSLRIAHIYGVAISKGYKPEEIGINYSKLAEYITKKVYDIKDDYLKAYACYVLKLNGDTSIDVTLYHLMAKYNQLDITSAALIGICYAKEPSIASQQNAAKIADYVRGFIKENAKSVTMIENPYNDYWQWYTSDSEQLAALLQLFTIIDPNNQINDKLLYSLLLQQKKGYWKNTASTARVLEAVSTYITYRNLDKTDFTGAAIINGEEVLTGNFEGVNAKPVTLNLPFESEFMSKLEKEKEYSVDFTKKGTGHLYYTMQLKYAIPTEMQTTVNNGIDMEVEYTDYETGAKITPKENSSVLELESGKIYRASITLASPSDLSYVAMRSPIPSGCEILDPSFSTTGTESEIEATSAMNYAYYNSLSNKVIYDNEIQFFWNNFDRGSSTVSFTFRAARKGVYTLPPVFAQCMYEEDIYTHGDGWLCTIK